MWLNIVTIIMTTIVIIGGSISVRILWNTARHLESAMDDATIAIQNLTDAFKVKDGGE
jgi:hypothetical protein